jgi:exodeoxyribonuclease-3
MKIATWNVNSVRMRLPAIQAWLQAVQPDILLLQEIKTVEADFPRTEFAALGYQAAVVGQKSYNGVALLSRHPIEDPVFQLSGDAQDEQARYVEASVAGLRVASLYLPNGNPVGTEKYPYKLQWMQHLQTHAKSLLKCGQPIILGGDFNIIPAAEDVYDPIAWATDALFCLESRRQFRRLLHLGYTDAFRALNAEPRRYTFWDYQAGRWPRDQGLRIDHFLLSPAATDRLADCTIDRSPRGAEKASDHTPVILTLQ